MLETKQGGLAKLLCVMVFLLVYSLSGAITCQAASVTLKWDPVPDASVTGYKVYYRTDSPAQPFQGTGAAQGASPIDVHTATSATLSGLDPTHVYFFAVTAYNAAGKESVYSDVINLFDTIAPTVSITSPLNNAPVAGTVSVTAAASDNFSVASVEFYVNGVLQLTDTSTPYLFSWNTKPLAAGSYMLTAKAYDDDGNVGTSGGVTVQVVNDVVAPTVSITTPANNATVSGTVTVSASASDNVGLSSLTIFQNGLALAAGNVSPLSTSWNTAAVANGSYILSARAYDVAGNPGVSSNVTVTVNNAIPAAPTASLTYPASGSTVSGMVVMTANASASAGVSRVAFYVNNVPQAADTIAPYSFNWDTTTVANGSYTLTAKATDTAGTVGSSSNVTVTVNNNKTAPTVSLTSPSGASTVSGTVAVTTSTSTGVSRVEFYVNSVLQTTSTSSPYTYSWNTAALASGSYTLSAKAYDAAGSAGTSSNVTVTVSNDKTAPTVSLTSPASGSTVSGTVAVTASASDNVGVSRVEFYVNNVLQTTSTSSPYTFSWNTTSLINGSYTLSAKAYDAAGNVGTSSNVSVTSNNAVIAPTVSVTSPSSGSTVSGTVTVTASASANTGVSKVEFYVNSVLQATDTSSPYSFSWNTAALANGSCILSAKAYDAAGNAGTSTNVTVTVNNDKTVPTVSLTAPTSGATVSGTVAVTASASDNVGVSKVEFYVNSILQTTVTGALYTFNWNTTAVANGSYTLTAKAYDAAGNVATSSNVTVTVNNINTAPTVSVTSPTSGATVSGTVVVTANASANAGITRVAFYVNNVAQAADTIAPYTYSWNTTTVANGSYALVAKVTDTAGTVVASSSVTVTVSN